jgi:hypothetical protein
MIDVMGNVVPMYDRVTLLNRVQAKYNNDRGSTELHHQLGTMISDMINNTTSQAVASTTKAVKKQYVIKDLTRVAVTPAAGSSLSESNPSESGNIAPTDIGSMPSSSPDPPSDSSSSLGPQELYPKYANLPIATLKEHWAQGMIDLGVFMTGKSSQ